MPPPLKSAALQSQEASLSETMERLRQTLASVEKVGAESPELQAARPVGAGMEQRRLGQLVESAAPIFEELDLPEYLPGHLPRKYFRSFLSYLRQPELRQKVLAYRWWANQHEVGGEQRVYQYVVLTEQGQLRLVDGTVPAPNGDFPNQELRYPTTADDWSLRHARVEKTREWEELGSKEIVFPYEALSKALTSAIERTREELEAEKHYLERRRARVQRELGGARLVR